MNRAKPIKIVADCDVPYLKGVLEPFAEVRYVKGVAICHDDLHDADALIIRTRTRCGRELLEGSSVKLIVTATIGFDHIDMGYCRAAGIEVVTAAGCNARGVLQWVAAVLAYASRVQGWAPSERTVGVVGVGHVGSLIAKYAKLWGFRVLCCDPPRVIAERGLNDGGERSFVSIDTIMEQADIITFHVPLNLTGEHATYHLADSSFLNKLRDNTLIVNSSRGEVIDSAALTDAAAEKSLSFAIDTWENEPHIDHNTLSQALVATTHIAGYSAQGKANGTSIAVNTISQHFGFMLKDWYPSQFVARTTPQDISWEDMCKTIAEHFDVEAETATLKSSPEEFENLRNNYSYRQEYF